MTLVVRDEEDILASNLDYHLAQGVELILALDHGSTDATPEILRDYERRGCLRFLRDDARPHDQAPRVARLLEIAAREHVEWVIHCDADEFWTPTTGSLRDVFATIPSRYGYLRAPRHDFLPGPGNGEPFHQRMTVRYRHSRNLRGTALEPKVAQRPAAGVVEPGNHDLTEPRMELAPDLGVLSVLHFAMRSYEQFERKVLRNGLGHEARADRPPLVGYDQLELLERQRRGELRAFYEARTRERDDLVADHRLQAFMAAGPQPAPDSPDARTLLTYAWTAQARHAELEAQRAELQLGLAAWRDEARELRSTLAEVRASRVMRLTEPIRRMYYWLR
jgi:hypothetical protein